MEKPKEKIDLSMFNLALPYLTRTNNLLSAISATYIKGNFEKMSWCIKALYRELAPKLNQDERQKFTNLFKVAMDHQINMRVQDKNEFLQNRALYVDVLEELDIMLREFLEVRGMLVPSVKDPRFLSGAKHG